MPAAITDKFNQATNGTRPVPTTLTATRAIGASSITVGALTGWPTATAVHFSIYQVDTSGNKVAGSQTDWKGTASGTTISNLTLEAGSDSGDSVGAIVECGPTAAWANDVVDGILVEHDQDGTHGDINADSITATTGTFTNLTIAGTATPEGWSALGATPDTVTALGNRSYSMVFNGTDLTDTLSPGMRLKMTRTVTAPTQCTDLEASSSQYFSKSSPAGMTFTDDFVVSAWVKLESYTAGNIISRYNGTSGWQLRVDATGTISLVGYNAGAANYSLITSSRSLPLNKWVHIAAQLDMSAFTTTTTTSYVMFDGMDVVSTVARGGTNPTALVQAGNLEVGSANATAYFDGKIAQVAVYSAKVTQATVLASMHQTLTGSETSLVSAYTFNNSLLDLNANDNDLTANGGALATDTDSPFAGGNVTEFTDGTVEMGIVTKTAFSTNTTLTVQVPESYAIPTSGGISAVSYSVQKTPYGFPTDKKRWRISIQQNYTNTGAVTAATFYNISGFLWTVPVGAFTIGFQGTVQNSRGANVFGPAEFFLSRSTSSSTDPDLGLGHYHASNVATIAQLVPMSFSGNINQTTATVWYLLKHSYTTDAEMGTRGDYGAAVVYADLDYV